MSEGANNLPKSLDQGVVGLRRALSEHHPALARIPERLIVLGAASEGKRLVEICERNGVEVVALLDDAASLNGTKVGRHLVEGSAKFNVLDRHIPVVIASHLTLNASRRLSGLGFEHVSPFATLQVLHRDVFAPHMFYSDWLEDLSENATRYTALSQRMADDKSRAVLDAVLSYRRTLRPEVFSAIIYPGEVYLGADIFTLSSHEVFVDGGSFDGDTIQTFLKLTAGKYERVLAFEPDPATFPKLVENFASDARVKPINAGLWSKTDVLRFHNDAGRASILGSDGDVTVNVVSLDEIAPEQKVTLLKMNIEGAELQALRGAASTIRKSMPNLAIAAYHRPSDLWQIAELIDQIAPNYNLHLRQHCGGVVETVLYATQR